MTKDGWTSEKVVGGRARWLGTILLLAASTAGAGDLQIHAVDVPFIEALWRTSGHADATARAFTNWNTANPPQVPVTCAKCHSSTGYQDFLGADGSAAGVVDKPAPVGTVIDCAACHNQVTTTLNRVTFPSGVELKNLGAEARCLNCHQGRTSQVAVDDAIKAQSLSDPDKLDTPNANLRFLNIHYHTAGATQYGGTTKGGYQYDGKAYDVMFAHVQGLDSCISCHDPHSLKIHVETCATCHPGVQTKEDLRKIRMVGSTPDYDGDGDALEGIAGEIAGLQAILYQAIQAYAAKAGAPIVYDGYANPYFFHDTNGNGTVDAGEAVSANRYTAFTPRLLKAAYNYQVSRKDPGAYAHNAKYVIQLLFDSVEDLDPALAAPLTRNDVGHFAGSNKQWRYWDAGGQVPGTCSKCHSGAGLPFFVQEEVTVSQPSANGMQCTTCHNAMPQFTRYEVRTALFPSGARLDTGDLGSNLCISCHQGRQSTASVTTAIAGLDLDTVSTKLSFLNIHYFAAGATLFGTQAKGAYEYPGKTYQGRLRHVASFDTCTECHETHTGELRTQGCTSPICHGNTKPRNMRKDTRDFDGDGNRTEGLSFEITGVAGLLYAAIQDYAVTVGKAPIVYDGSTHPYFFKDTNGNGKADPDEVISANRYANWTPRLLCAAYNYQYAKKDPGAYAHNGKYVLQVLYDSLADLGTKVPVNMTKLTRP